MKTSKSTTQVTRKPLSYNNIVFHQKVGTLVESKDYHLFNFIDTNRDITESTATYKNIFKQIAKDRGMRLGNGLVDVYGNIADGQHRLVMCMQLELPFTFRLVDKTDLNMIKLINNNQEKWTYKTTAHSEAKAGNINYKKYIQFMNRNPKIKTHNIRKMFLSQNKTNTGWKQGAYKAGNYTLANKMAKAFTDFSKYLKGRQQEFAGSWMEGFKSPQYSQQRFKKGVKAYAEIIERNKSKKVFISSPGYNSIDCPQTMDECNHLVNAIYNCAMPSYAQINLLPA